MNHNLAERDVASQLVSLMERLGWRPFRQQVFSGRRAGSQSWIYIGEKGMPDYRFEYYLLPGFTLTLYVETKRSKGGELSDEQSKWHFGMRARGALIYVMSDIEEFMEWYESHFGWLRTDGRSRVEKALAMISGA